MILFCGRPQRRIVTLKIFSLKQLKKVLGYLKKKGFSKENKTFYCYIVAYKGICHCTKTEVFHYEFLTFTEEILNGKLHYLCSN